VKVRDQSCQVSGFEYISWCLAGSDPDQVLVRFSRVDQHLTNPFLPGES